MTGYVFVHRRPNAGLKVHVPNLQWVSARNWHIDETRAAFVRALRMKPHSPWVPEEKVHRLRHLLEDNPASG
ncbi:MAG TPA: hypothetical protein VED87_02885 [Methylocystis sp.]|nr:hypothetical protein [Methylocystis sp.]